MEKSYLVNIKVRDCVDKNFIMVDQYTTLGELNHALLNHRVREAVISDDQENLMGIVTTTDLTKGYARGLQDDNFTYEVMSKNLVTVSPQEDLLEVRSYLRKLGVGRAPVVDKGKMIGMLTTISICDGFSQRLDSAVDFLHSIFNEMDYGVIISDSQGKIQYFNYKIQEIFALEHNLLDGPIGNLLDGETYGRSKENEIIFEIENQMFTLHTSEFDMERKTYFLTTLKDITKTKELIQELDRTKNKLIYLEDKLQRIKQDKVSFGAIKTSSRKMENVISICKRVAKTSATILLCGESGTGKEVFADAIYESSLISHKPFIKVNCGAIPYNLCESEFFGYEKGAFTGASKEGKMGLFEAANQGTIFLDEIGELHLDMQAKLLRVLQEHSFYRVGGTKPVHIQVRVIAATNKDLKEMVKEGSFRKDLYYRLNVININLPSLRDRREDVIPLAKDFLHMYSKEYDVDIKAIQPKVIEYLTHYSWPGNIRELKNVMERLVILSEEGIIKEKFLPESVINSPQENNILGIEDEKELIQRAIKKYKYKTKVAEALNMPRSTLYYKMKAYNIDL